MRGLLRSRPDEIRPHPGPVPADGPTNVAGGRSGALRAAIFGVNDGLVSNLSLIMGFTGAAVDNSIVVIAGVAGLLAGAFSMAAGEYISMRSQREVFERLIHLEAHELATEPEEEREELIEIYRKKGVPEDVAEQLVDVLHRDPDLALETHAREELGLDPEQGLGSPWAAAGSSMLTFMFGAFVPLVPFLIGSGPTAVAWAIGLSGVTLFAVGAGLSRITGKNLWWSGARMLLVGGVAAGITYSVGKALHVNTTG
ncbi:MAG TPA: VIT1/CCC1 transporter family protein [Actinomycetota bacterium]|nr:VIT1/CCC1 transporter family protein [Actinomycetota bacterium]